MANYRLNSENQYEVTTDTEGAKSSDQVELEARLLHNSVSQDLRVDPHESVQILITILQVVMGSADISEEDSQQAIVAFNALKAKYAKLAAVTTKYEAIKASLEEGTGVVDVVGLDTRPPL